MMSSYLSCKHGARGNLHVVAQFEVAQEVYGVNQIAATVDSEAHVGNWLPRKQVAHQILGDNADTWCLHMDNKGSPFFNAT